MTKNETPKGRTVVVEQSGQISLVSYSGDTTRVVLSMEPPEAIVLATDLLVAVRRRSGRGQQEAA